MTMLWPSAVAVKCEKDVGMGLCTFNFVFRLSLHLVCIFFLKNDFFLLTCKQCDSAIVD